LFLQLALGAGTTLQQDIKTRLKRTRPRFINANVTDALLDQIRYRNNFESVCDALQIVSDILKDGTEVTDGDQDGLLPRQQDPPTVVTRKLDVLARHGRPTDILIQSLKYFLV
jgi:hypothetical protein